jgi:hypothetical protein
MGKYKESELKECVCTKCGSTIMKRRKHKKATCDNCLREHYKAKRGEINSKKKKIREDHEIFDGNENSDFVRRWVFGIVPNNLKIKGDFKNQLSEQLLQKLIDQDFKCYYTGLPLVPNHNASLEHIKPRSKNPELIYDVSNLVWVRKEINSMRSNYSFSEFIDLCQQCVNSPVLLQLAQSEKEEEKIVQYEDYVI